MLDALISGFSFKLQFIMAEGARSSRGGGSRSGGGRGGGRGRRGDNGFEAWGGYMAAKKAKLQEQFAETAVADQDSRATDVKKGIFAGVAIFVNGYTGELKVLSELAVRQKLASVESFLIANPFLIGSPDYFALGKSVSTEKCTIAKSLIESSDCIVRMVYIQSNTFVCDTLYLQRFCISLCNEIFLINSRPFRR